MRKFNSSQRRNFSARDFDRPRDRLRRRDNDRFEERGPREFRSREHREMFEVICDSCGKPCQVPFKPSVNKPVYCNNCFRKQDSSEPRGRPGNSGREWDEINRKLDKILKALELE